MSPCTRKNTFSVSAKLRFLCRIRWSKGSRKARRGGPSSPHRRQTWKVKQL